MDSIIDSITHLLHRIYDVEHWIRVGGLLALTVIVFAETGLLAGFFLPGDSLLVTAGLFAATGVLDLWSLLVVLSVAAIVGDSVGYWFGAKSGPRVFRREDSLFFNRKHLITTKEFFDKHGPFTIVIARFMPIIRTFAPVVAGVGRMRYGRFLAYNVFGGILWIWSLTLLGYFLGKVIPDVGRYVHLIIAVVVLASIAPGIIKLVQTRRSARAIPMAARRLPPEAEELEEAVRDDPS
ncbi:MAG: VTT domain-containing protein [Gemmatimonadetes bacterium]|nr:VTT domain-containing protein [Gemmatimonadota bacterium]